MGLQTQPGQLGRFIGLFYKVNSKRPPSRPQQMHHLVVDRVVMSKGRLMILSGDATIHVEIDPIDQVDQETYEGMLQILTNELATMLHASHLKGDIHASLLGGGIAAYYDGGSLRVHPLTEGLGEIQS